MQTDCGPIPVKIAEDLGGFYNAAAEFDACRRASLEHKIPLKRVMAAAHGVAHDSRVGLSRSAIHAPTPFNAEESSTIHKMK